MSIEEGEIKNISTEYNGTNRLGDYGKDDDGIYYCWTGKEWRPFNAIQKEAIYWQKKYEALLKNKNT